MGLFFRNSYKVLIKKSDREFRPQLERDYIRKGRVPDVGDVVGFVYGGFAGHAHNFCPVVEQRKSFFGRPVVVIDFDARKEASCNELLCRQLFKSSDGQE